MARNTRAGQAFDGLTKRVATGDFKLVYNPVDSHLLDKMNKEVKHLLSRGRVKLHGCDEGQPVSAFDAFACALPPSFLLNLKKWILTADDIDDSIVSNFQRHHCILGRRNQHAYLPDIVYGAMRL